MRLWVPMPSCAPPPVAARPCSRSIRCAAASRSAVAQMTWSARIGCSLPGIAGARSPSSLSMSDFLALDTLVLDPRFNGPPGSANGGYACGAVGELVDGPAEVTLLSPPPLGAPMGVHFRPEGAVELTGHHGVTIARARPVDGIHVEPPVRPTLADAREASRRPPGRARVGLLSPSSVGGPRRHDGLGIPFGPLRGHAGVTAS